MVRYSFSLCSMLSVVLVLPTFSRAPAKRVSYSSIDPLTFSRLRTESGLESRPVAPETVLKVLLCTSRLKEEEEEEDEDTEGDGSSSNEGDGSSSAFGVAWQEGDVLGLACDMVNKSVSFSVNGSFQPPLGVAFQNIAAASIAPAFSAWNGCKVVANFGQLPLKHAPPDETYVSVHAAAQK